MQSRTLPSGCTAAPVGARPSWIAPALLPQLVGPPGRPNAAPENAITAGRHVVDRERGAVHDHVRNRDRHGRFLFATGATAAWSSGRARDDASSTGSSRSERLDGVSPNAHFLARFLQATSCTPSPGLIGTAVGGAHYRMAGPQFPFPSTVFREATR
jgi:hypothetical protein